ncbi:MAG: ABC transporter permease [Candidatus Cryosericum sp.]
MSVVRRGVRNAFRNTARTVSITLILGLSIAVSLTMFLALRAVQSKIDEVKSSIGNTITVSPAGVRGFEGGGDLLTGEDASVIAALPHVATVTEILSDRLQTGSTTTLASAIEPGSFGARQNSAAGTTSPLGTGAQRTFSMPVTVMSSSNPQAVSSLGVSSFTLTSGTMFASDSTDSVAVVGKDLATKNALSVGSAFTAYGTSIKVDGIFDAGNTFSNSMLIMPIKTLQTLSKQADQLNSIIVQTDSIDTVSTVQTAITAKLGTKADVVSQQDTASQAIAPLQNIKAISTYSLAGSLVAGSLIILLTMIMVVRERRREIGVLKAIGSSNAGIVEQFAVESLTLTTMGSFVGILLGSLLSNPVLKLMLTSTETASGPGAFAGAGGRIIGRFGAGMASAATAVRNIQAVVGWDIILYGFLAAIVIAVVGSAIPSFAIAKVRPAEVMRTE